MDKMAPGSISFSKASKKTGSFGSILEFLIVCMIVSIVHPQTEEWMKTYMDPIILILETILLRDDALRKTLQSRGLTLKKILDDLRKGVKKHHIQGKKFGVNLFVSGSDSSYSLNPIFFVFFKRLVNDVLKNPLPDKTKFSYQLRVTMRTRDERVWNFKPKEKLIFKLLDGVLDSSKFLDLYGRDFCYCSLFVQTKTDADTVIQKLNGETIKLPIKVTLSVELMSEQIKKASNKPKEASSASKEVPAQKNNRFIKVEIVESDSNQPVEILHNDILFLRWVISIKRTDETADEVSEKVRKDKKYIPYVHDLNICHHVSKKFFLWLKFESEEKAQEAISRINGTSYYYGPNHKEPNHFVVACITDLRY